MYLSREQENIYQIQMRLENDYPLDLRPSWDEYFLAIAKVVASRASCPRARVGSVIIAPDHGILSTGYDGRETGKPSCLEVGCRVEDNHCQLAIHSELNAVAWLAKHGTSIPIGSRIYIWSSRGDKEPCRECKKVLKATGLEWVM